MEEKEFKALVRLLEDDDPTVADHVEEKLLSMGEDVIPRLEHSWESSANPVIQTRIEEIIHEIQSRKTMLELREWRRAGGGDLLKGWFLVSRFHYPEIKFEDYKNEINRLVNRTWLEVRESMSAAEKLAVLNRMIFTKEKYNPNTKDPDSPDNMFINQVFTRKKGSPIALGLVYMVICQKLDLPVNGLILPGYFALCYGDNQSEFYIDVYNRGAFFVKKDLQKFLNKMKLKDDPKYFKPSSKVYVILEFIRLLATYYRKNKEKEKSDALLQLLKDIDPK